MYNDKEIMNGKELRFILNYKHDDVGNMLIVFV